MPRSGTNRFKLVGDHPEDLADGRVLAPGDYADLTSEQQDDDHNKALIDAERLIPADGVELPDGQEALQPLPAADESATSDDDNPPPPPPPAPGEGQGKAKGQGKNGGNN